MHGILHWTDAGVASWYDFACAIAEEALAAGLLSQAVEVAAITHRGLPDPGAPPGQQRARYGGQRRAAGPEPDPWRDNLRATLAELPRS